jgi:hypothetical protein
MLGEHISYPASKNAPESFPFAILARSSLFAIRWIK